MSLVPLQPPGRITRKARAYEADIAKLRAQGYTLESIRIALAGAGIEVSLSTVWREATRSRGMAATGTTRQQPDSHSGTAAVRQAVSFLDLPAPGDSAPAGAVSEPAYDAGNRATTPSGKDVAEAFRRSQTANPLIRASCINRPKEPS